MLVGVVQQLVVAVAAGLPGPLHAPTGWMLPAASLQWPSLLVAAAAAVLAVALDVALAVALDVEAGVPRLHEEGVRRLPGK